MSCFVTTIDPVIGDKILHDLKDQGFTFTKPQYTRFQAKKKGLSVTLYESGKLMVQGKEMNAFIEFYLEPNVLHTFTHSHKEALLDLNPRIGIDEAGKGDFFGPLCIAGVYADGEMIQELSKIGVKDSKTMSDKKIFELAKKIRNIASYQVVKILPKKYNELYKKFRNLNDLLAWGHATCIEELIQKTGCDTVIIDQFANERVVERALKKKGIAPNLTQRHRGEEDIVVAASSILARAAFLYGLKDLGDTIGVPLPKGASQAVIQTGRLILNKFGEEKLDTLVKLHFKTRELL